MHLLTKNRKLRPDLLLILHTKFSKIWASQKIPRLVPKIPPESPCQRSWSWGKCTCTEKIYILWYSKINVRWVSRMLGGKRPSLLSVKGCWIDMAKGNALLDQIATAGYTRCHHHKPKSQQQSMKWHFLHCPSTKKLNLQCSVAKVMCTVF